MVAFPTAQAVIERAIHERVFPGAVIEVGTTAGAVSQAAFGKLTYEAAATASSVETVYDLASLTKVVCTTAIAMRLVESGRLRLSDRLVQWLPQWRGPQRDAVTVRHLLAHSAGLAAWAPLFRTWSGRDEIQSAICRLPLDYSPGSAAVYSDLGFILLGFVLAEAGGAALDVQF